MYKIMWVAAENQKPIKDTFNNSPRSPEVLFWVKNEAAPKYGKWDGLAEVWQFKQNGAIGYYAEREVKYFAYIDNPYK